MEGFFTLGKSNHMKGSVINITAYQASNIDAAAEMLQIKPT